VVNEDPPPPEVVNAGHETRDLSIPLVVTAAIVLVLCGVVLLVALWQWSEFEVPEQKVPGASPPAVMPGERSVDDRVRAVPAPRLDPLEPLRAHPESYRSSARAPNGASPTQHPEDLRADRQPELQKYEWVEKGKVARIPIGKAMDALVEGERAKAAQAGEKKGDKK
jgi:hypothetical protein